MWCSNDDDDEDKILVLVVDGDGVLIRKRVTQRLGRLGEVVDGGDPRISQDDRNQVSIWPFFIYHHVVLMMTLMMTTMRKAEESRNPVIIWLLSPCGL